MEGWNIVGNIVRMFRYTVFDKNLYANVTNTEGMGKAQGRYCIFYIYRESYQLLLCVCMQSLSISATFSSNSLFGEAVLVSGGAEAAAGVAFGVAGRRVSDEEDGLVLGSGLRQLAAKPPELTCRVEFVSGRPLVLLVVEECVEDEEPRSVLPRRLDCVITTCSQTLQITARYPFFLLIIIISVISKHEKAPSRQLSRWRCN